MGRPTLYDRKRTTGQARFICRTWGADRECLAKALGISLATLYDWEKQHPEFLEAVRQGSAEHDDEVVERSLLRLCKGFQTTKRVYAKDLKNFVDIEINVPPDVRAIALWQANRNRWRIGAGWQLGPGLPAETGKQELVEALEIARLGVEIMENRHQTKIHVESEVKDGQEKTESEREERTGATDRGQNPAN